MGKKVSYESVHTEVTIAGRSFDLVVRVYADGRVKFVSLTENKFE